MNVLRKNLLLATGLVMMVACAPKAPAVDTAAEEAALKADPQAFMDAFNSGNADALANLYTEDALLLPPGAPTATGRAAIRDFASAEIQKAKAAGLTFKSDEITGVGFSGDLGWLSGKYSITDASGTAVDKGKFMSVYHKVNGDWQLIRDTWNSDLAPAAAAPPAAAEGAPPPAQPTK